MFAQFSKIYWIFGIAILCVIIAIYHNSYNSVKAENQRLESELTSAITLNAEQSKTLESLMREHENQLRAINSANAEKSRLNKDLKGLKNEIKNQNGDAVSVFNFTIERLWNKNAN